MTGDEGELTLAVAEVVDATDAEGPGARFALWFQGCPFRCPGCCNPEFLAFGTREPVTLASVNARLNAAHARHALEGISLLGGEPFAHVDGAVALAGSARSLDLSVMVYTGYTLEELHAQSSTGTERLLALTDVLVDGRYDRTRPEPSRRWVGSANQRVHFLTTRYDPADPCWTRPNTLEIRLVGRELVVNGFPAASAKPFWSGWKRGGR